MEKTYTVATIVLVDLVPKLESLARRAKRLGCPPISWEISKDTSVVTKRYNIYTNAITLVDGVPEPNANFKDRVIPMSTIKVIGDPPVVNGYLFVARLDHGEKGNIIYKVGEENDIPEKYRDIDPLCDHCNTLRRRNNTFVIRHEETGEWRQIGRNCLCDYLGGRSPQAIALIAEAWIEISEMIKLASDMEEKLGGSKHSLSLYTVLYMAACVIRNNGWVSRAMANKAEETTGERQATTADLVSYHMFLNKDPLRPNNDDIAIADESLAWVRGFGDRRTDYEHNLSILVERGYCDYKSFNLAVSIVGSYLRTKEKLALTSRKQSNHIGNIGEKIVVTLTLKASRVCESQFGISTLHNLVDVDGNVFNWFEKGHSNLVEGSTIKLAGKVKEHKEFGGVKKTVLYYCKVLPC